MADAIFGPAFSPPDPVPLRARIQKLKSEPREDDANWWNDLAGAHLRLGEPNDAVKLLEPVVGRFSDDYGVHANLGTAYHLLGRHRDAEREIARDLEINPEGHFGLEKYHLALLQYLSQSVEYQKQHVYVDEFTNDFNEPKWDDLEIMPLYGSRLETNAPPTVPAYRRKWNLASDTNLQDGVIYMATLNPKEAACFVMLGIACLQQPDYQRDLNLAVRAFEKAIELGSPQRSLLAAHIDIIRSHMQKARAEKMLPVTLIVSLLLFALSIAAIIFLARWLVRKLKRH